MFDFSKAQSSGGSPSDALRDLPDGTMFVCKFHLADQTFSDLNPTYYVRDKFNNPSLVNFFYEMTVQTPVQFSGRVLLGRKPVTADEQRRYGVDYPGIEKDCARGDRSVLAILSFDALARGIAPNLTLNSYDELEGRFCAVQVATWQGKKCLQFLSPERPKEKMTCELLVSSWRQIAQTAQSAPAQPRPQPPQQPPVPPAPPAYNAAPQPQYQPAQPATPPPARIERTYPQQNLVPGGYGQPQRSPNGWPTAQSESDDDIPF